VKGCIAGITDGKDLKKFVVEMGSGGMIYVPSSITIESGIK
jgi:hypothetical protein